MLRDNLLTLDCEVVDGIGLMRLEGELIAESRYEPERILREWLETDVCGVIIQFNQVTHIDSAGLSTLLGALHRYRRHDGDLILAELNPSLNAIFEVTSMQRYFKIFEDMAAAQNHFKPLVEAKKKAAAQAAKKKVVMRKKKKAIAPREVPQPKSKKAKTAVKPAALKKKAKKKAAKARVAPARRPARKAVARKKTPRR